MTRSRYRPGRGGHAPGILRDCFLAYLDRQWPDYESRHLNTPLEAMVVSDFVGPYVGKERTLRWLLGQLWNCTDTLAAFDCDALGIPHGSTYAQAVRLLKRELEVAK